jgi:hypothetical protein
MDALGEVFGVGLRDNIVIPAYPSGNFGVQALNLSWYRAGTNHENSYFPKG